MAKLLPANAKASVVLYQLPGSFRFVGDHGTGGFVTGLCGGHGEAFVFSSTAVVGVYLYQYGTWRTGRDFFSVCTDRS